MIIVILLCVHLLKSVRVCMEDLSLLETLKDLTFFVNQLAISKQGTDSIRDVGIIIYIHIQEYWD